MLLHTHVNAREKPFLQAIQVFKTVLVKTVSSILLVTKYSISNLFTLRPYIFLVCYVDHHKQDVDAQIYRLTQKLVSQDYDHWQIIIHELDREKEFNFTASSLFDINKRLELSSISELIMLTVLFEQLLSKLPVE